MSEPSTAKTGECYYRDPDGSLWRADSYRDESDWVSTQSLYIEPPAVEVTSAENPTTQGGFFSNGEWIVFDGFI